MIPNKSLNNLCIAAKAVVFCIGIHVGIWARAVFGEIHSDGIDSFMGGLMFLSIILGIACSINAIRYRGIANHIVGIIGLLWFGCFVLLQVCTF
jgi:hypothetical protein